MESKAEIPGESSRGAIWAKRLAILLTLVAISVGGYKGIYAIRLQMIESRGFAVETIFASLSGGLNQYHGMSGRFMPWRDSEAGPELDIEYWGEYTQSIAEEFLSFDLTDPFSPVSGRMVRYWGDDSKWTIWSAGPDRDYDLLNPEDYADSDSNAYERLQSFIYDPSNGAISSGDLLYIYRPAPEPQPDGGE